jgi:putative ABC transport system permease protein
VNEAMADLYGFAPGSVVELPIAGKPAAFTVAGVWRDYARPQGAVVIERARYVALTGDNTATNGALWLAPGSNADEINRSILREVPGAQRLEVAAPAKSASSRSRLRSHLCGHLRARACRGRHRPVRPVVVVRRR